MILKEKYDDQLYENIWYIQDYGHERIVPTGPMNVKYITDHVLSYLRILGTDEIKREVWFQLYGKIWYIQDYSNDKIVSRGPVNILYKFRQWTSHTL